MNKYVKAYFQRGLAFGGFGPIVTGIVLCLIQLSGGEVMLNGGQMFIAVLSTYVLAFVQAGASVFNQVEDWPIAKAMGLHFISLYVVYVGCYLVNAWIPFRWEVIVLFTVIFLVTYLVIWLTVYFIVKRVSGKLNASIQRK